MKRLFAALLGATIVSATLISVATPAFALGGCGPNGHRNAWGYCVFGGQNQNGAMQLTPMPTRYSVSMHGALSSEYDRSDGYVSDRGSVP